MLELKQISKRFGDKQILSDFNLLVPENRSSPLLDLLEEERPLCFVC